MRMAQQGQPQNHRYTFGHDKNATTSHESRTAEQYAAFLIPHLSKTSRILDVGCGPGTITSSLARYVPSGQVIGVDSSSKVIEHARDLASQIPNGGHPPNLEFAEGDVLKGLPFKDASFDVVYSSNTLVHLSDPVGAIAEMKRLLKPDTGIFATVNGDSGTFTFSPDPTGKLSQWGALMGKLVVFGGAISSVGGREVNAWAQRAGFTSDMVRNSASAVVYSTKEERKWWASTHKGRLEKGSIREELLKMGMQESELGDYVKAFEAWAEDETGWYGMMMCEMLGFA